MSIREGGAGWVCGAAGSAASSETAQTAKNKKAKLWIRADFTEVGWCEDGGRTAYLNKE